MLQARADLTAVRRSERVQTGLDKSISGLNPKLDCGLVQGQMLNHGLDQGPVQKGSGSNCGSGLNRGKPSNDGEEVTNQEDGEDMEDINGGQGRAVRGRAIWDKTEILGY